MSNRYHPDPCLCGAPDCPSCFPYTWHRFEDEEQESVEAGERQRQWETDQAILEDKEEGRREDERCED